MRGKNHNAAIARKIPLLEQDIRDWKRRAGEQRREIDDLTAQVKLMPALKERVAVLEMQNELATCDEIAELNRIVEKQRAQIAELEEHAAHSMKIHDRLYDVIVNDPRLRASQRIQALMDLIGHEVAGVPEGTRVIPQGMPPQVARKLGHKAMERIERARGQ